MIVEKRKIKMDLQLQVKSILKEHKNDLHSIQHVYRPNRNVSLTTHIENIVKSDVVKNHLQTKPELLQKVRTLAQSAHQTGKLSSEQYIQVSEYLA